MASGNTSQFTSSHAYGTNYCKLPDGTLIQWGNSGATLDANGKATVHVVFPIEFYQTSPAVCVSCFTGGESYVTNNCIGYNRTNATLDVYLSNPAQKNWGTEVSWAAFGKWK